MKITKQELAPGLVQEIENPKDVRVDELSTRITDLSEEVRVLSERPTGGDTTGLSKQINSLQDQVTGVAKEQAYMKLKTAAQDRLENGNGTVFAHDMNGNIIGMTLDEANSQNIVIRDGKMMMIAKSEVTRTATDSTVINQAYDTSGNGGRKLVRLSNGWLVAATKVATGYYLYKSVDSGLNWTALFNYVGLTSFQDLSIVAKGNYIYSLFGLNNNSIGYHIINGLDGTRPFSGALDSGQTAIGNVSLAINEQGTELHATWSSKNATYPNSWNIRYAKGVISQVDGSVTWGAVEQVTSHNVSTTNNISPTIVIVNGKAIILIDYTAASANLNVIYALAKDGLANPPSGAGSFLWSWSLVYNGGAYDQSSPSAIFVPKSVNGLANGRIWVAWHGKSVAFTGNDNIFSSYSDDGGITWSTASMLTGSSDHSYNSSISANSKNETFITYTTRISSYFRVFVLKKIGNANWNTPLDITGTRSENLLDVNTLNDLSLDFSTPLFIYKGTSKVGFYGTWQEPVETPSLTAKAVYDLPSTDFVGLFVKRFWLSPIDTKTALFVNDIPMESTSDMTKGEVMYKKQLDSKAPVKLRIELSRDSIPASPNENFNGITRILGGRS